MSKLVVTIVPFVILGKIFIIPIGFLEFSANLKSIFELKFSFPHCSDKNSATSSYCAFFKNINTSDSLLISFANSIR